jgi:hypothetical protein
MNIYVCSTVRHLLFSLLKASEEPEQEHDILFFSDFQNASLDDWNLDHLPENIVVYNVARQHFRHLLSQTAKGKLYYFLAMRNLAAPTLIREAFTAILESECPDFNARFQQKDNHRLWLFNERNKMSRLFRLLVPTFSILEDGSGNYLEIKTLWWKWPVRALLGRPPRYILFGEDRRCTEILAIFPDRLPDYVKAKGKTIDFLNTPQAKELVRTLLGNKLPTTAIIVIGPKEPSSM